VISTDMNNIHAELYLPIGSLPELGMVDRASNDYLEPFRNCISNKKVLCIGYSEGEIERYVARFEPSSITCLTYWAGHRDSEVAKYPLVIGDITKRTEFEDGAFDTVISLALMEHLHDLKGGLEEMRRITRNGGDVLCQFGPAWSSPYGHHLYIKAGDPYLDFTKWRLPAFLHLLCSREDIAKFYREKGYTSDEINNVFYWFYEGEHINRRMYDDYIFLFNEIFQIQSIETMSNLVPDNILKMLRLKFGLYKDFSSYGSKCWMKVVK
jgi:SAM-dependent methyltransferase